METTNCKVLIPNATSTRNVGDAAMLRILIQLIKENIPKCKLTIHSSEPDQYRPSNAYTLRSTLYYWAVFSDTNLITRLSKIICLGVTYLQLKLNLPLIAPTSLKMIINDYQEADLMVFVGGGYLRSKKGVKQSLNLIMTLMMFIFSRLFKTKKIVAPISFGPFGYHWHEQLSALIVKDLNYLSVRERYSYAVLKKYQPSNIILSSDHALLIKKKSTKITTELTNILGFTIRNWLPDQEQKKLEEIYLQTMIKAANQYNLTIQPIIQVDAPHFGDLDRKITYRLLKSLKNAGVKVLKCQTVLNIDNAKVIYASIDLLLGMRMHSNILAATQGTPFVAISYEYKTEGIAHDLGLADYCIKCEEITQTNLLKLISKAITNRAQIKQKMENNLHTIQQRETARWMQVFKKYK